MRIDVHAHSQFDMFSCVSADIVDFYRDRGIDKIVLIEPFDVCIRAAEKFPDFVVPVALINMNIAGEEDIDRCISGGCRGIKFIAPDFPYGDRRYWYLYEALEALNKPAVFHTGYLTSNFAYFEWNNQNIDFMRACQIDIIARRFPRLKILMSHFSNPWWEEAWKISFSNANVYADLSGGTAFRRSLDMWAQIFSPNGDILVKSFERLCFGSDVPYFSGEEMLFMPYIEFYERLFEKIGLSEEYRKKVNFENAAKLFGLDC